MFNEEWEAIESFERLEDVVGTNGLSGITNDSFGYSYNSNEFTLLQLLRVTDQRLNSSKNFWYWIKHLDEAPDWFRAEYKTKAIRLTQSVVNSDSDLIKHIRHYEADLRSGKKVVIVGHSQGNMFANNAKRYFRFYKNGIYSNSIGIVAVGSPSDLNGNEATFFTTNTNDRIINFVRAFFPNTLPGNVTYDITPSNHEFVKAYLFPPFMQSRIRNHVYQTANSLKQPEIDFECKDPKDVPIEIKTLPAREITNYSARMHGEIVSGKLIDVFFCL